MPDALRKQTLEYAYEDLKLMVYELTHKTAYRFGIPFEDLLSEAHCIFIASIDTYDSTKGAKLSSWLYSRLQWRLISFLRKELKHRNLDSIQNEDLKDKLDAELKVNPQRSITEIKEELGPRGRKVVEILAEKDSSFRLKCKVAQPRGIKETKKLLAEHLETEGWTENRIKRAFSDVEDVLKPSHKRTRGKGTPEVFLIDRLKSNRAEMWLVSRVGLTPQKVRSLTKK